MSYLLKKGTRIQLADADRPELVVACGKVVALRKRTTGEMVEDLIIRTADGHEVWVNGQYHKGEIGDQITLGSYRSGEVVRKEKRTVEVEDVCFEGTEGALDGRQGWIVGESVLAILQEEDGSCTILMKSIHVLH